MDSHVVGGGIGEDCKWAKSTKTFGTLWSVYLKHIDNECVYTLQSNLFN